MHAPHSTAPSSSTTAPWQQWSSTIGDQQSLPGSNLLNHAGTSVGPQPPAGAAIAPLHSQQMSNMAHVNVNDMNVLGNMLSQGMFPPQALQQQPQAQSYDLVAAQQPASLSFAQQQRQPPTSGGSHSHMTLPSTPGVGQFQQQLQMPFNFPTPPPGAGPPPSQQFQAPNWLMAAAVQQQAQMAPNGSFQPMPFTGNHQFATTAATTAGAPQALSPFNMMPPLPIIPPTPPSSAPPPSGPIGQHAQLQQQQQQQQQLGFDTGASQTLGMFTSPIGSTQPPQPPQIPPTMLQAHLATLERIAMFQQRINELQRSVATNPGQGSMPSPFQRELDMIKNQQQVLLNQAHGFIRANGGHERVAHELRVFSLNRQQQQSQQHQQQQQAPQQAQQQQRPPPMAQPQIVPQMPPFPPPQPPSVPNSGQAHMLGHNLAPNVLMPPGMQHQQQNLPPAASSLPPSLPFSFVPSPTAIAFNSTPTSMMQNLPLRPTSSAAKSGSGTQSSASRQAGPQQQQQQSAQEATNNVPTTTTTTAPIMGPPPKKPPFNRTVSMPAGLKTQVAAAARVQALKSNQPSPQPVIQPPKLLKTTPIIPLTSLPNGPSKNAVAAATQSVAASENGDAIVNMITTPEASGSTSSSPRSIAPLPRAKDARPATVILADDTPGMPTLAQLQSQLSAEAFYTTLRQLFGNKIDVALPSFAGSVPVDLYKLYQTVVLAGQGGEQVTNDNRWTDIAQMLSLPTDVQAVKELQEVYETKVAPFELVWSRILLSQRQQIFEQMQARQRSQSAGGNTLNGVSTAQASNQGDVSINGVTPPASSGTAALSNTSNLSRTQSLPTRRPAEFEDSRQPATTSKLKPPEDDRRRKRTKSGEMAFTQQHQQQQQTSTQLDQPQKQSSPLLASKDIKMVTTPARTASPLSFTVPALAHEDDPVSDRAIASLQSMAVQGTGDVGASDKMSLTGVPPSQDTDNDMLTSSYMWDSFGQFDNGGVGDNVHGTHDRVSIGQSLPSSMDDWSSNVDEWSTSFGVKTNLDNAQTHSHEPFDFDGELAKWNSEAGF
ncbi:hypothetical protein OIO90_002855 [Microbotryomycetes sp. JL221]|nr:hypothetical protein OIO90_002855 [Microbotryomycetes sp. JL221]